MEKNEIVMRFPTFDEPTEAEMARYRAISAARIGQNAAIVARWHRDEPTGRWRSIWRLHAPAMGRFGDELYCSTCREASDFADPESWPCASASALMGINEPKEGA